uniref:hypothetical protein n=1 Tax=Thiolapillus sp. TaxID=2017437 RepID=UPI0025FED5E4
LLRTWLPMTGRRVRRPTLFSLWRKARRENSAASRLLGSTSFRFALHGWQRWSLASNLEEHGAEYVIEVLKEVNKLGETSSHSHNGETKK